MLKTDSCKIATRYAVIQENSFLDTAGAMALTWCAKGFSHDYIHAKVY